MGGKHLFLGRFLEVEYRNTRSIVLNFEKKYRVCNQSYIPKAGNNYDYNCTLELVMKVSCHYDVISTKYLQCRPAFLRKECLHFANEM